MIAWIDIESSNLDERTGHLLEVALVLTYDDLEEFSVMDVVIFPSCGVENLTMIPLVREMHTKNGLLAEAASVGVSAQTAEKALMEFVLSQVKAHSDSSTEAETVLALKKIPIGGSTIGFDRRWLRHYMPALEGMFSYRSIDVSTITELAKRWAKDIYEKRPLGDAHRALADIRASIALLKYYRNSDFLYL